MIVISAMRPVASGPRALEENNMGISQAVVGVPGVLGGVSTAVRVYNYLDSLATPTLDVRFNEITGNLINYGSDGNSGAVTSATQAQSGQLGANEAYLFDGVDDIITFTNDNLPATKALTTHRWCFLLNAATLGESSIGRFFQWSSGANTRIQFLSTNRLYATIDTATTDAVALTNNNQVDFIAAWALVFMDYDDTDAMSLGRKIRLWRATATQAASLLTLATDTAAVGAVVTPTGTLTLGNDATTVATFSGTIDFMWCSAGLWTPTAAPTDLTILNQLRSLVFGV